MFKYFFWSILVFLVVILQVSFLPSFQIYGGTVNLPLVVLGYYFYLQNKSSKKNIKIIFIASALGVLIDLLSGGLFLSATISLLVIALLFENLERLISLDHDGPFSLPLIFAAAIIYDLLYLILNRMFVFNAYTILPILFDATLSFIFFLLIFIVVQRFSNRRHEIKLS